jgi:hypothetical protein
MPEENSQNAWERTYSHFKEGYKNAQDAIRFVDTKSGVLTGLLMITTAVPFEVLKWSAGLEAGYPANLQIFQCNHHFTFLIILWGSIWGIALGVCGVAFSVEGLAPRSPKKHYQGVGGSIKRWADILGGKHKKKNDKPPITVLFPFHNEKAEAVAEKFFHAAASGMTEKQILREYAAQLKQVGRILCLKIECNQRAALCFRWQLWSYLVTAVLAFIAVTFFSL